MIERLSVTLACVSVAALCSVLAPLAHAADIYRWVDEKGLTHISDTVPPQYRKNATRIDTSASQVSESDRALAAERAAREKAALDSSQPVPAKAPRAGEVPAPVSPSVQQTTRDYGPQEVLRTPVFWVMYVMFVMVGAGGLMATAQLAPIAKDFKVDGVAVSVLGLTLRAWAGAVSGGGAARVDPLPRGRMARPPPRDFHDGAFVDEVALHVDDQKGGAFLVERPWLVGVLRHFHSSHLS